MWIIGHRGAAGTVPENTLASVQHALHCEADWIEIDVRLAAGNIIVLHDETVDRTTNGAGRVDDKDFDSLRALDAGGGERIPLLGEVIELIDATAGLNIEIKQNGIVAAVNAICTEHMDRNEAWRDRFMLSSFLPEVVAALAHEPPAHCLVAVLSDRDPYEHLQQALRQRAYSLNIALALLDENIVAEAHAAGLKLLVFTVNTEADIERCLAIGVDGIFTDHPARALRIRDAQ